MYQSRFTVSGLATKVFIKLNPITCYRPNCLWGLSHKQQTMAYLYPFEYK